MKTRKYCFNSTISETTIQKQNRIGLASKEDSVLLKKMVPNFIASRFTSICILWHQLAQ